MGINKNITITIIVIFSFICSMYCYCNIPFCLTVDSYVIAYTDSSPGVTEIEKQKIISRDEWGALKPIKKNENTNPQSYDNSSYRN